MSTISIYFIRKCEIKSSLLIYYLNVCIICKECRDNIHGNFHGDYAIHKIRETKSSNHYVENVLPVSSTSNRLYWSVRVYKNNSPQHNAQVSKVLDLIGKEKRHVWLSRDQESKFVTRMKIYSYNNKINKSR